MFEVFGDKWVFQYSRDDFIPQYERRSVMRLIDADALFSDREV